MEIVFLIFFLFLFHQGLLQDVDLKVEPKEHNLIITCRTDQLTSRIVITDALDKQVGICHAPVRPGIFGTCSTPNTTQYLTNNVTNITVDIHDNDITICGVWKCVHGTKRGIGTFNMTGGGCKQKANICNKEEECSDFISRIMWSWHEVTVSGVISSLLWIIFFQRNVLRSWMASILEKADGGEESQPLITKETRHDAGISSNDRCSMCTMMTVSTFCVDCTTMYCVICCNTHIRLYPTHQVCQIDHGICNSCDVRCNSCNNDIAVMICLSCRKVLCSECCTHHDDDHVVKMLVMTKRQGGRNAEIENLPKITFQYTIKTVDNKNLTARISGLCFLKDGRIVISKYNYECKQLVIYKGESVHFEHNLTQEPKGMTNITNNRIAITYPYERQIKLYEIGDSSVNETESFQYKDKPFSIAYNQNHFAVEMGEGDNGFIAIIKDSGEIKHMVKNITAYFTSNSIRLALDMNNRKVFVSALSKKEVTCVDFDGNVLWRQPVPSPRSIVFVENVPPEKNIILASKKMTLVYLMDSDNGENKIIMKSTDIASPRYIDYNLDEKLLCIQIKTGPILVYKFDITKDNKEVGE